MHITEIIKYPLLTEKSYAKIEEGYYTFEVARNVTKTQIKKAFEIIFEVEIEKVNTVNIRSSKKRVGRYSGYTNKRKKAIIKLKPGQKLNIFNESDSEKK